MTNKRVKIIEASETMNTISLQDLLTLSTKVLSAVLQLQTSALSFNNQRVMALATKLNSNASEFHNVISELVMEGDVTSSDVTDEKTNLSAPSKPDLGQKQLESVKVKYLKKKLKEAEGEDEETDVNDDIPTDDTIKDDDKTEGNHDELVIDLTEPFSKVINGLDDSEFSEFKSDVVSKLEDSMDDVEQEVGSEKGDEYANAVTAIDAAKQPEDFDFALNQLYDFADKNEIIVETVKKTKKNIIKRK